MTAAPRLDFYPHLLCYESAISEHQELLELLGWDELPQEVIALISEDLQNYATELEERYSARDRTSRSRRSSIRYWIEQYRAGVVDGEALLDILSNFLGD